MTNMEFYRDEIEKIIDGGLTTIAVKSVKWLMSEHKDKPTITARERHFLKFIETGWLVRDTSDGVWWFRKRPQKTETMWNTTSRCQYITELVDDAFPFIKWEDKEPWSVEELLKLEVQK